LFPVTSPHKRDDIRIPPFPPQEKRIHFQDAFFLLLSRNIVLELLDD
jgi:hypothetical protein